MWMAVLVVVFTTPGVFRFSGSRGFRGLFTGSGPVPPAPTLFVMGLSNFFVNYWYIIFPAVIGGVWGFFELWKRSVPVQVYMDRLMLKVPVFGDLIKKSTIARWTRTLSIMFAAGVPLVEALDSVGGASGNYVYAVATKEIQRKVSTGTSLHPSMHESNLFLNIVLPLQP